jgi:serine/threonine protein phosphatase PrpC
MSNPNGQTNMHLSPLVSHIALAVSTPGGHIAMEDNTPTITLPRLRLPHKEAHHVPVTQPRRAARSYPFQQSPLQELPTQPTVSPPTVVADHFSLHPLHVGIGWHGGILRSHKPNEDGLVTLQSTCTYQGQLVPFSLFVVADGMGGHDCGLEASRLAIQNMMHTTLQTIIMGNELSEEFLIDMLVGAVQWANLAIYQHAQEHRKDMGTTLTAALIVDTKALVVNVGDSRTYLYRSTASRRLAPITHDHSLVARLVELGEIAPEEIYTHPERNKVYRCLGTNEEVEVDWFVVDLHSQDQLLLCSDGLWEMVRDFEIERILNYDIDPGRTCNMLVQAALRGGGHDNISVIVVHIP